MNSFDYQAYMMKPSYDIYYTHPGFIENMKATGLQLDTIYYNRMNGMKFVNLRQ